MLLENPKLVLLVFSLIILNQAVTDGQGSQGQGYTNHERIADSDSEDDDMAPESKDDFFEKAIFNTTVNFIVPMFRVKIPKYSTSGDGMDLMYQILLAGFGIFAAVGYIGLPSALGIWLKSSEFTNSEELERKTNWRQKRELPLRTSSLNHTLFINEIGLDWSECLKKTICEANLNCASKRYGLLSLPFQIFFPKPDNISANLHAIPIPIDYQIAAVNGFHGQECSSKYKCFFDVLALGVQLIDLFKHCTIYSDF